MMSEVYIFKSPIGLLKLCSDKDTITGLSLLQKGTEAALTQNVIRHSDLLHEAYTQIQQYFSGQRTHFELPLSGGGTAFQEKVWRELRNIPYGETRSYEDIAVAIGNPKAFRAVGQANNKNPLLILNPCHRVIHKNGDITGFGCGIEVKRFLLELEAP